MTAAGDPLPPCSGGGQSEATVDLLARTVFMAPMIGGMDWDVITDEDRDRYRRVARGQLDALAAAGRLLPEGAELRTEWAVWWLGPSGGIRLSQEHLTSRTEAEQMAPDRIGKYGIVRWELRYRELHDFADGSCLSGPWSAVPPESEES
jgi:hypothetical protein